MTPPKDEFEKKILKILTCPETEALEPPYRIMANPVDAWLLLKVKRIVEALTQAYERGLEDAAKIAEEFKFKGDYKDCPAAWINTCYDKFAKALRQRSQGKEGGK